MTQRDFAAGLPSIETANLVLRQITDADVPALFTVFSNAEVVRYWSSPALADLAGARALANHIDESRRSGELLQWAVTRRGEDRLIGTCTLARIDHANRRAEIGYALARDQWGLGVMREALPALLRFAFATLGLHRIEADVDPRNVASIRSLERLGFRLEGHLRERYFVADEVQDSFIYGLLSTDTPRTWDDPPPT